MANTYPNSHALLKKIFDHLKISTNKSNEDFQFYNIDLIENSKPNKIYMYITTILKEYPTIMKDASINETDYKKFSTELKDYTLTSTNKNKSFCDLILFDIICSMRLDLLSKEASYANSDEIELVEMCKLLDPPEFLDLDSSIVYGIIKNKDFLGYNYVKKALKIINDFIKNFSISMEKKYKLYNILNVILNKFYGQTPPASPPASPPLAGKGSVAAKDYTDNLKRIFNKLIDANEIGCAPRTIIHGLNGGYNNKSGDIDYHICKANFKQTFKKVSAKSAREAAKMIAMKVLKDKKKSAKFSLKRMIGKKEKCYDYDASIDKSGKIIIKNQ